MELSPANLQSAYKGALKELEGSVAAVADRNVRFANPGIRDFMQSLVVEDNLLPSIIDVIETYDELQQCWTIWSANEDPGRRSLQDQVLWINALDRMFVTHTGHSIDRLTLSIEVYDEFQDEAALDRVRVALNEFDTIGLVSRI